MAYLGPTRASSNYPLVRSIRSHAPLAVSVGLMTLPILVLVWLLPPPLVLPVFGLLSLSGAAIAGLLAWCIGAERNSENVTAWDAAGALAFIGCAATILGEPEQMLQLMQQATVAD